MFASAASPDSYSPVLQDRPRDPIGWMALVPLGFVLLALNRLTVIDKPLFDEVHYLPAARALLAGSHLLNPEHPLLGKGALAIGIALFGDNPWGWRLGSVAAGTLALFAAMRAVWWASLSRFAALATGVLVATNFTLLVQARTAMLDIYMIAPAVAALWMGAAAVRRPRQARARLAAAGVLLGLALAAKWSAAAMIGFAGIGLAVARWPALRSGWRQWLIARDAAPFPGISLIEGLLWLVAVPLAVYAASFAPIPLLDRPPPQWNGVIAWQQHMWDLQRSVTKTHGYMSNWYHWVINYRPVWYFYEHYAGAQRGVLLLGNPLTMLAGLWGLVACIRLAWRHGRKDCGWAAAAYGAAMAMWVIAPKPVQFYYHYILPSILLMGCLALALDAYCWRRGRRWRAYAVIGGSCLLFAWFYPILTAARLPSKISFADYAWFQSWR